MTEREFIELILNHVNEVWEDKTDLYSVSGPYTTLYWDKTKGDNVPQQSMTVKIGEQQFEVIVRNK